MNIGTLLLVGLGVWGLASAFDQPKGFDVPGDETITVYKDRQIAVAVVDADIPEPWRWRVSDSSGEPIANAFGYAASQAAAVAAATAWIDANPIEGSEGAPRSPERPDPEPPPVPKPGKGPKVMKLPTCEIKKYDGPVSICLYPTPHNGKFAYRLTGPNNAQHTKGSFATRDLALLDAYAYSAKTWPGVSVADEKYTRFGFTVNPDGGIFPVQHDEIVASATPIVAKQLSNPQSTPATVALAVLGAAFPTTNPYRFKWKGSAAGLEQFIGRLQEHKTLGGWNVATIAEAFYSE